MSVRRSIGRGLQPDKCPAQGPLPRLFLAFPLGPKTAPSALPGGDAVLTPCPPLPCALTQKHLGVWDEKGLKTGPPTSPPFSAQADLHPCCQGSEWAGRGSRQPGSLLLRCPSSFPCVTLFLAAAPRFSASLLPWLQHHPAFSIQISLTADLSLTQ